LLAKTLIQTETKHLLFHIPGVIIAGCHGSKTVGTLVEKFTSSSWKLTEYGFCLECSTSTQSETSTFQMCVDLTIFEGQESIQSPSPLLPLPSSPPLSLFSLTLLSHPLPLLSPCTQLPITCTHTECSYVHTSPGGTLGNTQEYQQWSNAHHT